MPKTVTKKHQKVLIGFLIGICLSLPGLLTAQEAYQVTAKAWKANAQKEWDTVIQLAENAEKQWGAKAKEQNSNLTSYPNKEKAKQHALLNEMATLTLLKGNAQLEKGDKEAALETYKKLMTDYKYGQCWDPKGWYWQPAKSARDQINKIAPGSFKITLKTAPLPEKLKLPGKRGIGFALRDPESKMAKSHGGSWTENLPKLKALNPYWNYTWGKTYVPGQPEDVEFIPMAWGAWGKEDLQKDLDELVVPKIKDGTMKRFLGFNEPDHHGQANMKYMDALQYWPQLEALNVPLASPGCANTLGIEDNDSAQGIKGTWMRDFMREVDKRGYRVDYVAVHWYGGASPTAFKEYLVKVYNKYGKRPLIITEFAPADWGAKSPEDNSHSPDSVLAFMKDVLPWMEEQNWIAGYAWFPFRIDSKVGTCSALFGKDGNLTACGKYYRSITNENLQGDQSIKPDPRHYK